MIRKFITELLAEVGITLPEKKEKVVESNAILLERRKQFHFTETWEVRWASRHGDYSGDTKPEIAAFASREEAEEFGEVLRDSFRLIRHTSGTRVVVQKGN